MRIAIISDIHANDLAFAACLDEARRLKSDRLVLLGDLVGYGPAPEETVQRVMALAAEGAIVIKGNHDQAISRPDNAMNPIAAAAIEWTRHHLSPAAKTFLRQLPLTAQGDGLLFVHADASAPERWNYITSPAEARRSLLATTARVTFCGHVHVPQLYCLTATAKLVPHTPVTGSGVPLSQQRQWLAVIGSAGQPRDGNPAAAFATFDTDSRELVYRRVPYDWDAVAARIRAAALPEQLAQRLAVGR